MASEQANLLTVAYRRQQLAVRAAALQDITRAWPLWTPGQVKEFGRFTAVAVPLLGARHNQAAALAAGYYRRFREAEGVRGGDTPRLPPGLRPDDVVPSLRATALAGTMRALRAGFSPQAASQAGLTQALGTAGRLTLNGGRDALLASVSADPAAAGWQRIASGGACDFCRMLAGRGPAYKGERTASFQAHDHCACSAEPVFERAPVPAGGLAGGSGRAGSGSGGPGQGGAGGNGPPPAPPTGAGDEEPPPRLLPRGPVTPGLPSTQDVAGSVPETPPPSFADIVDAGRVAATWATFTPGERQVAEWLRDQGVDVEAVRKDQGKSPDGIIRAAGITVEIKTLTSAKKLEQRIWDAKQQAGHVVLDIRATGLTEADARARVAEALRRHGRGVEELLVIGQGFVLSWP